MSEKRRFHHYELVIEVAKAIDGSQPSEWRVSWDNMSGQLHDHYFQQARTVLARLDELGLAIVDKAMFEAKYGPQWVLSKKSGTNLDAGEPLNSATRADPNKVGGFSPYKHPEVKDD